MTTGIELISKERQEQFEKHGRTVWQDAKYNDMNQLSEAASYLCLPIPNTQQIPFEWDEEYWFKVINKSYKERLIIAGALIAAEIDRLNFIEKNNG